MNRIFLVIIAVFTLINCKPQVESNGKVGDYESFGEKITAEDAMSQGEMLTKFKEMKMGDTINVKFASNVNAVCQAKGCWMKLDLDPETSAMVKFKDYDFFVPKNATDSEAIVEGKAYVGEIPVEELKHYAEDAGKSEEEIAAITEPEVTYNFEATGVLLK